MFARAEERIVQGYSDCTGHESRIPQAGEDFLLNVSDESLIVARDRQRAVRAFCKVDRHRGTRICEAVSEVTGGCNPDSSWPAHRACRNLLRVQPINVTDLLGVDEYRYKQRMYKRSEHHRD